MSPASSAIGASAVHPWLAFGIINSLCENSRISLPFAKAEANFRTALESGLLKVMARMGISTVNSYHAGQLFDTVCLDRDFVYEFFPGTAVTVEADGTAEIEGSLLNRHAAGFDAENPVRWNAPMNGSGVT